MLKILQARVQQYVNCELADVQAGFRKGRVTRDQIANIRWIIKKARVPEKHLLYWLRQSLWLCGWQQTGKLWKRWEYQTTLPASWEICMQIKKQQLELDMEQQTGSKSWKEYVKAVYCHPAYLTFMQSTSWEMAGLEEAQAGIKIARRNINNLRYADDTTLLSESEELKSLLMKVKERGEWKSWLKAQHSVNEDHGIWSHHFMANRWGNSGNGERFYFGGLQNHCRWWLQPWN